MYENTGTAIRPSAMSVGNYHAQSATEVSPPTGRLTEAEQETVKLLEALGQAVQRLEQRIAPILTPAGPTGVGTGEKAQREPSPFAGALIANNQKLYGLIGYVQELSARVDF